MNEPENLRSENIVRRISAHMEQNKKDCLTITAKSDLTKHNIPDLLDTQHPGLARESLPGFASIGAARLLSWD